MKLFVHFTFTLLFFVFSAAGVNRLQAQAGIFNPNDPVVNYDAVHPPTKPASGQVGKWVRTPRVSWSTTTYKCYAYNSGGNVIAFRLKFPKNYDSTKAYPLLIFFHGLGEYGPSIYDNEYQLYHGGALHAAAVDNGQFNGFLLYPQHTNTSGIWSSTNMATVYNLVTKVMIPQGKVDPFRVYVNGLSAGGGTTWQFMGKYTQLVAAATPISSAYSGLFDSAQKYKFTPIYHFQGGQDTDPSPSSARSLGNKILGIGGNYKYKEFADRAHDCWYQAWNEPDYFPFYARAHKANPWPLFGRTEYCQGDAVGLTLGVTAGFDGYEWRKNGVLISGATSNTIQVTALGTYDCRIKYGSTWSVWSPIPVTIGIKPMTTQPAIVLSGNVSNVIPAPDGSTTVALEVPDGYASYKWIKEGSTTVLSSTRSLTASAAGNYKVQVTEKFGCGFNTSVVSVAAATTRVQAEAYSVMTGVVKETCGDTGGGQDIGNIDQNDWIDYNINAPTTGTYNIKFRLASASTGARFEVRGSGGVILTSISVPNTGAWQKYVDVTSTLPLNGGIQTLRLYSTATARWNINYFDLTNPAGTSGTSDGYSQSFPVVNAAGSNGPDAATNLTATALSKTSLQLQWSQNATPAFNETGFEVYEATTSGGPFTYKIKTAANATGFTLYDLKPGTPYYYKVRAVNNTAAAAVAGPATATTQTDVTAPTTPINLTVGTITRSTVDLSWTASSDDVGVDYYDVYINGVKWYAVPKTSTKATMYNLVPAKTYTFFLKARDLAGNLSGASNQVSAKTLTGAHKLDPTMGSNPANYSAYINMNADNPAPAPWYNTNILPSEGTSWTNIRNYATDNSGIKMKIINNYSGYNPNGVNTGSNAGVYPDLVMRASYYCDKGQVARVQLYGLSLNHKYTFVFFGSRSGTGDRTSVYTIGSQHVSLNASNNSTQTVQIDNVSPDQNGNVYFEVSLGPTALYAYLNALVIKAYSLTAAPTTSTQAAATTLSSTLVPEAVTSTQAQVYPNPVQGDAVVSVVLQQAVPQLTLQLSDASGRLLRTERYSGVPQGVWQQPVPLSGVQPGVYLLRLSGLPHGASQTLRILKTK